MKLSQITYIIFVIILSCIKIPKLDVIFGIENILKKLALEVSNEY